MKLGIIIYCLILTLYERITRDAQIKIVSPDTDSDYICHYQVQIGYHCSLFPKFKMSVYGVVSV